MESFSCYPTTLEDTTCLGVWLILTKCHSTDENGFSPFPSRYQLQTVSWLGVDGVSTFTSPCLDFAWYYLLQVLCHSLCEFINAIKKKKSLKTYPRKYPKPIAYKLLIQILLCSQFQRWTGKWLLLSTWAQVIYLPRTFFISVHTRYNSTHTNPPRETLLLFSHLSSWCLPLASLANPLQPTHTPLLKSY